MDSQPPVHSGKVNDIVSFFVSDLHGHIDRYEKLFTRIAEDRPAATFLGGDLFPPFSIPQDSDLIGIRDFVDDFLIAKFTRLREKLGSSYPRVYLILGNDDVRADEPAMMRGADRGERLRFEILSRRLMPRSPYSSD